MSHLRDYATAKKLATTLAFIAVLLPATLFAQTATAVFEKVKDSVFVVKTFDAKGAQIMLGSAVLLPGGKFATNDHVVKDGASFTIGQGKHSLTAVIFAEDANKDVALLEAKPDILDKANGENALARTPAQIGNTAGLKVGQPVYAVGAPEGLELSISEGIISQLRGDPPPMIQTTAAISPGSSGGGLFDSDGRLIGLTALYIQGGQNLNFALPVEWLAGVKPGQAQFGEKRSEAGWLARAAELEKKEDWAGLRDWSLAWTKSAPGSALAWVCLGEAYGGLKRYSDAIDAYRQALRIDPNDAGAWYNLGVAYGGLKRYSDAINAYRQALRIDPNDADAWCNLGVAYGGLKRYSDAIDACRQALRIDPNNATVWCFLGNAHIGLQRRGEAIDAYRQALRIDPNDASAWRNLGFAYAGLQRYSDAIDACRQALRIDPNDAYAWRNLGVAYAGLQRYSDAIDACRHALRIDLNDAASWYVLGLSQLLAGDRGAALETVKALRTIDPQKADELFNRIVPP